MGILGVMVSVPADPVFGTGTGAEFELLLSRPPPGVELERRPLVRLPVDHDAWAKRALAPWSEMRSEVQIDIRETRSLQTEEGWPLSIVRSDLVDPSGVIEHRVHGLYAIDGYGAVVVARGEVDCHRDELDELLRTARSRHCPRVVAIAQVWEGFPEEDRP